MHVYNLENGFYYACIISDACQHNISTSLEPIVLLKFPLSNALKISYCMLQLRMFSCAQSIVY